MFISGLGTAVPVQRYTQAECWQVAQSAEEVRSLSARSQILIRKILLGDSGIEARHLAVSSLREMLAVDADTLHQRFIEQAPRLGAEAVNSSVADAGKSLEDIDALIVSTCTGYLCPGLTSYISERLGLRSDCLLLDLVGQGCGAALPNLRTAEALLASGRAECVISLCVEVCSAAFYLDNDPGVLVSACLFGDGAAAAILERQAPRNKRAVAWKGAWTRISPAERDQLRFEQRGGLLRNILSKNVPTLAAREVESVLQMGLTHSAVPRNEITGWILHSGGKNILDAVRAKLQLDDSALDWSAEVLREYGNMSSPCVLFVLKAALAAKAAGGWWWMSSFGAGFSCHGALLKVD